MTRWFRVSVLAGGGRYDKLIGQSLGRDVPACGFSLGFERIVDLLTTVSRREAVAVLFDTDVAVADALALARRIRAEQRCVSVMRRSGGLPAQLGRLKGWSFTSFLHLRSGQIPEECLLGSPATPCRPGQGPRDPC